MIFMYDRKQMLSSRGRLVISQADACKVTFVGLQQQAQTCMCSDRWLK